MSKTVQDMFKQFCKERHKEDKGKNFNLLQEVYAQTEFFDTTLFESSAKDKDLVESNGMEYVLNVPNFSLPFQTNFIKVRKETGIFIREFAPNIITGSLFAIPDVPNSKDLSVNTTFTINVENDKVTISTNYDLTKADFYTVGFINLSLALVAKTCLILNSLSHKSVAVDKPANPNQYEYYSRKKAPAIKVPRRPIYYVLGEKNEDTESKYKRIKTVIGKLEYTHCFRVRGHWRKINDRSFGKDRNGNYSITGYTWVNEYTKGEGELVKRLRVVK